MQLIYQPTNVTAPTPPEGKTVLSHAVKVDDEDSGQLHLLVPKDEDATAGRHLLAHLAMDATPVHVEGDVEYLINRNSRGWVVTLFNDNGVFKPQQGLAQVDRSKSVSATISLRGKRISNAVEWTLDQPVPINKDSITINIAPGSLAVVELVTTR